jgi:hypothetical protein
MFWLIPIVFVSGVAFGCLLIVILDYQSTFPLCDDEDYKPRVYYKLYQRVGGCMGEQWHECLNNGKSTGWLSLADLSNYTRDTTKFSRGAVLRIVRVEEYLLEEVGNALSERVL